MSEPSGWRSAKGCSSNECIAVRLWLADDEDPSELIEISPGRGLATRKEWAVFVAGIKAGDFDDV